MFMEVIIVQLGSRCLNNKESERYHRMKRSNKKKQVNFKVEGLIIVILYAVWGFFWFFISDLIVSKYISDPELVSRIRFYDSFIFIILSSLFLYLYMFSKLRKYNSIIQKVVEAYNKFSYLHHNLIIPADLEDSTAFFEDINYTLVDELGLTISGPNDLIWDWDLVNNKYYFSNSWKILFGYHDLENTFEQWRSLIHPDDLSKALQAINDYLNHKTSTYHNIYRVRTKAGDYRWVLSRGTATWENGVAVRLTGSHTDITEKQELEKRLFNLAYFDTVTKLPNRAYMELKISSHLETLTEKDVFAIAYIDLDNFKHINEIKGHHAGDALLKHIASLLTKHFQAPNIVGNISTDEFILALINVKGMQDVFTQISHLNDILRKVWHYDSHDFFITTSIGVAIYPDHGKTFDELLINADLARNSAKEMGKDRYVYYNLSIRERTLKQIEIANLLRSAIAKGDLELYYQPQIDPRSHRIIALEALLRWNQSQKGAISPAEFIPVAERNGLIDQLTDYVLEKAFQQKVEWNKKGLKDIRMTINISPLNLMQDGLIIKLKHLFNKYRLRPSEFELEITETALMDDLKKVIQNLSQLKSLGVRIALDDFGSGYSSLTYLQQLPIDVLKLDQNLIRTIKSENDDAYILKMIIDIAHYLGLVVVAEGVETKEQLIVMTQHQCDLIQGFYFSKPLPSKKVEEKIYSLVKMT